MTDNNLEKSGLTLILGSAVSALVGIFLIAPFDIWWGASVFVVGAAGAVIGVAMVSYVLLVKMWRGK